MQLEVPEKHTSFNQIAREIIPLRYYLSIIYIYENYYLFIHIIKQTIEFYKTTVG